MARFRSTRACAAACPALFGLVIVLLAACAGADAAIPQRGTIQVAGQTRTFLFYTPEGAARAGKRAILMVLHGGEGNGSRVAAQTSLASYVDRSGFIAIFPDSGQRQWNDGRSTTQSASDDVAFLRALIALAVQKWNADPARVFVAGVSNGGMMALRMGCEASDAVTAVAVVAANMATELVSKCQPSRPVPLLMFSGTSDPIMPWNGGTVASSQIFGGAGGEVASTLETYNLWRKADDCPQPQITNVTPMIKRYTAAECRARSEVVLYEIDGGGHAWPGSAKPQGPFARRIFGYETKDISASSLLIQFFQQYGL
jgi:polyhydroxybutyrate depolymerase